MSSHPVYRSIPPTLKRSDQVAEMVLLLFTSCREGSFSATRFLSSVPRSSTGVPESLLAGVAMVGRVESAYSSGVG